MKKESSEIIRLDFDHFLSPHSLDDLGQVIWLLGASIPRLIKQK